MAHIFCLVHPSRLCKRYFFFSTQSHTDRKENLKKLRALRAFAFHIFILLHSLVINFRRTYCHFENLRDNIFKSTSTNPKHSRTIKGWRPPQHRRGLHLLPAQPFALPAGVGETVIDQSNPGFHPRLPAATGSDFCTGFHPMVNSKQACRPEIFTCQELTP